MQSKLSRKCAANASDNGLKQNQTDVEEGANHFIDFLDIDQVEPRCVYCGVVAESWQCAAAMNRKKCPAREGKVRLSVKIGTSAGTSLGTVVPEKAPQSTEGADAAQKKQKLTETKYLKKEA